MFPKFVLLWTDAVMWALVVAMLVYAGFVQRRAPLKASWARVFRDAPAFASAIVLALCLVVTLLDSVHFRRALPSSAAAGTAVAYDTRTQSVLDALLSGDGCGGHFRCIYPNMTIAAAATAKTTAAV